MLNNKITLAIVGVGYWGPNLLRNLYLNDKCILKYAVDKSQERREFI